MKPFQYLFIATVFIALVNSCVPFGSQAVSTPTKNNPDATHVSDANIEPPERGNANVKILNDLSQLKIRLYGEWDVGEESPLTYIVQEVGDRDELLVYDRKQSILYKTTVAMVQRIYPVTALRKMNKQLVFEYGEGGNDSYVQMLDFDENRIFEKIESSKAENSFSGDVGIHPQFRTNTKSAVEPFEILLTSPGLASPSDKVTKVFRYDGKTYHYSGQFIRSKIDDFKEELLQK